MKRCINPKCGLQNLDGAKECKSCGSKNMVPIEQPVKVSAPSAPFAQADIFRTTGSTTIYLGALPVLDKSAVGSRDGGANDNKSGVSRPLVDTTPYEQPTPGPHIKLTDSPLSWLIAQFTQHFGRTLGIISLVGTIIGIFISLIGLPQLRPSYDKLFNNPPTIKIIAPSPPSISLGEDAQLTALTEDRDGDSLFYDWTPSAGKIIGSGAHVTLSTDGIDAQTAPSDIVVTLTISDQRGGYDQLRQPIRVLNDKPIIKSIVPVKSQLQAGEDVKLIALAEDPNGKTQTLSFKWNSSEGQINQDGSSIATLDTAKIKVRLGPIQIMVYLTVKNEAGRLTSGYVPLSILPQAGTIIRGRKRIRTSLKLEVGPVKPVNSQEVNSQTAPKQESPSSSKPAIQTEQPKEKSNPSSPPSESSPGMPP
jgi:hypothetical protein